MKIKQLFHGLKCNIQGDGEIEIRDLKYDSRTVKKGDLFFCIAGFAEDGHAYAPQAAAAGAAAIVVTEYQHSLAITQIVVKDSREIMAICACRFFGHPARELKTVGITGTNGKTTTTYMIKKIAEEAGMKVGLIGTIVNMIGQETLHTDRTTPESIDLQRLLRKMVQEGCNLLVMEVSSHSLLLKRVCGMTFDIGVFTNLTQDHLDFHHTWENYIYAKSVLFEQSEISVINIDDDSAANMIAAAKSEVVTYGVAQPAQYTAKDVVLTHEKTEYDVEYGGGILHLSVAIPGKFTVYNSLAAATAAFCAGIEPHFVQEGLKKLPPVAGRFELLDTRGQDFSVILDYAHTPDSLENTLATIRDFAPGRVVTVVGCGGNRDAGKRPLMGGIAGRYSDFTVITSDNPRFEEPQAIIEQIEEGIRGTGARYVCIENRRKAIEYAIMGAQAKDIILLAGKGHETYQEICGIKHDFDEKVVVQEILDELGIVAPA